MTIARVPIHDDSDLIVARRIVRELSREQGLVAAAGEALATAVTEIVRNIVIHAGSGELTIETPAETRSHRRGVVVTARDGGPGISNIDLAMRDGYSTVGSLGLGLPSAQRLVDEFEIVSTLGGGTTVTLRKWASGGLNVEDREPGPCALPSTIRWYVSSNGGEYAIQRPLDVPMAVPAP